jgi:homoserine kinase
VKQQVTIRVPASTSNLGPGFDCLGVALRLYTTVILRPARNSPLPLIASEASRRFFAATRASEFSFACKIDAEVPIARGLGSSATVRLGVLHALNELSGGLLSRNELFVLCAGLEGHPDNAAASSFGGFNVARNLKTQQFNVSGRLQFVLLIPDFAVETDKARRLLPPTIDRTDAVLSSTNSAAIVAAFASGTYENLRCAFRDGLHQPYRRPLVPFLDAVISAAEDAGALGAFLSGSGSSICAVTLRNAVQIGQAMKQASGLRSVRFLVTTADNRGVRLLDSSQAPSHFGK